MACTFNFLVQYRHVEQQNYTDKKINNSTLIFITVQILNGLRNKKATVANATFSFLIYEEHQICSLTYT